MVILPYKVGTNVLLNDNIPSDENLKKHKFGIKIICNIQCLYTESSNSSCCQI